MKHLNLTLIAILLSFVSFAQAPGPIIGVPNLCMGSTITYSDAVTGGTWSSTATGVATIDMTSGDIIALTLGTATISYTTSGGTVTQDVTVNPLPAPVAGPTSVCVSATITLTDANTDGSWFASGAASVNSVTGDVTGLFGGLATIYYTTPAGCSSSYNVTVNSGPFPYPMSGDGIACSGTAGVDIQLLGSNPGVSYQLYNGSTPVGPAVLGVGTVVDFGSFTAGGTYSVVGTNAGGCATDMSSTSIIYPAASPVIHTVTGTGSICVGAPGLTVGLDGSDAGIDYQLYNGTTAVGAPMTGTGGALVFLTTTTGATFTVTASDPSSGCGSTMSGSAVITVNPLPTIFTIGGGGSYCAGTSGLDLVLSGSTTGVNYQLFDGGVAVSSAVPGTGTTIDFGLHTSGTYTIVATNPTTGCTRAMASSALVSAVMLTPTVSIVSSPGGAVCTGTSVTYGAAPVYGGATPVYAWSVNGTLTTTTGSTYTYVPGNNDVITVKLTSSLPCAAPDTAIGHDSMIVITPVITATSNSVCGGSDLLVAHGGVSYIWAPATGLSCSTCDTATVAPTSTIVYTITGTDAYGCVGTTTVTADGNSISGHIGLTGTPGSIRVWLIKYNPADSSLTAVDSVMACLDNGIPYYSFKDKPTGNYYVKAQQLGGTAGTSGYVATYGTNSIHWDAASTVVHGTGTDTMHIDLQYGILTPGPGFISGFIYSGAGRGTTTQVPVVGMMVYLTDATSGNVLTYTYTNSDGYYEFPHLAYSSYIVYPEVYHYYTTPAYVITLTTIHVGVTNIDFKQHTNYGIITPYINPDQVQPISANSGISVFPNPTSGNLNILWAGQQTGDAHVSVTDVVGREVFTTTVDMNAANGQAQINLGALKNGIYMINVRSVGNMFSGKLMIQQ